MSLLNNTYCSFVNLDERTDRLLHIDEQLRRIGLSAVRQRGIPVSELDSKLEDVCPKMWNGTRGAIGCYLSQVKIMEGALDKNKNAMILEDDAEFCSDFHERVEHITRFTEKHEWDIIFLGGTYHADLPQWHNKKHSNLKGCECTLNKDFEFTDDERIVRTYGCWGTYGYIVNKKSIEKVKLLLNKHLHETVGIDWSLIRVQPQLHCYAFVPGCVKQYDSESNIGSGMTYFSNFYRLGGHWFADKMGEYMPEQFMYDVQFRGTGITYRHELIKLIRYFNLPEIAVAVGVGCGDFSQEMLAWDIDKLYLIDTWEHQPNVRGDSSEPQGWHDGNYEKTKRVVEPFKNIVTIIKSYSTEAASRIPDNSIGLAYIDGNHAYEYVRDDIEAYFPKLVEGGIMAFHDYLSPAYGVNRAVNEFAYGKYKVNLIPDIHDANCGAWFQKVMK
jgi:GR25 family glycosyltransferase involved in LPS biosynthesis